MTLNQLFQTHSENQETIPKYLKENMKTMSHQKEEIEILRKNRNSRVEKYN